MAEIMGVRIEQIETSNASQGFSFNALLLMHDEIIAEIKGEGDGDIIFDFTDNACEQKLCDIADNYFNKYPAELYTDKIRQFIEILYELQLLEQQYEIGIQKECKYLIVVRPFGNKNYDNTEAIPTIAMNVSKWTGKLRKQIIDFYPNAKLEVYSSLDDFIIK